jgi:diaminohydroxyphosphoribosylaminopyrimidine deaminase/5-amino-6-(5-phosphoribosylamino)uracil reductase
MPRAADEAYLARAVELARRGEGHTRPNPPVGAVIVKDGKIVGEGWHRRAGGDHAEVAAIKNARRRGIDPAGAAIYVTLEPCSRQGRVGPCTGAIAEAGITQVVYAVADPNPQNRGRAARVLARAGVKCRRHPFPAAEELIRPFAKHIATAMPFVTVKIAMSLDGRICDDAGGARWISSERSRAITGGLRNRVDAIMVGAETVRRDDPALLPHRGRNDDLLRVVVTRSGRLPRSSRIFTDGRNETRVFKAGGEGGLREVMSELGKAGVMWILCEGGLKLARSLAEEGLVDEWITVLAPVVIGSKPVGEKILLRTSGTPELVEKEGDVIVRSVCSRD